MTTPSEPAQAQREALEAFDDAYAVYLQAIAQVPDEALAYLPPGDDYALGILPVHLGHPIQRYMAVLDRVEASGFGTVDLAAEPGWVETETRRDRELVGRAPAPSERAQLLADLDALHRGAHNRLAAYDPATFARTAPVVYAADTDAYPTSAHAVAGWLADHYREHTVQTQQMLAGWRTSSA